MKKIILGVFVFLIVLIIAAPFLIPTKFISDKISAAVGQNLHKKTVIQSVRFSIFPRIGIKVSGLEIGTARTDDYFVTLGSLFVELEWKPLLKKQVSISQIALSKPVIEFYTTLESPPAEKTEKRGSPGIELNIDSLKIDDLSFTMFDEKLNPTFLVSGLSEKLSFNYSADGTATIQGTTIIPT
jgi:uncharacterized protein involved in outer membrane biogenesis